MGAGAEADGLGAFAAGADDLDRTTKPLVFSSDHVDDDQGAHDRAARSRGRDLDRTEGVGDGQRLGPHVDDAARHTERRRRQSIGGGERHVMPGSRKPVGALPKAA